MRPAETEGLWGFSLRTYACSGVPESCLALQDGYGADVNLLLYCCWAGGRTGPLDAVFFDEVLSFSREWSAGAVKPLRGARRWMKSDGCTAKGVDTDACMALREKVKRAELEAERLQQHALEGRPLPPRSGAGPESVAANLVHYFRSTGAALDRDALGHLEVIVRAAYPDAPGNWAERFRRALEDPDPGVN